jgi:hypothetical protein
VSDDLLNHVAEILGGAAALAQAEAESKGLHGLDFRPACDATVHGSRCTRVAEFAGACKSSGCTETVGLICGVCLDQAAVRHWTCKTCGSSGFFRDVHQLTPLGGA